MATATFRAEQQADAPPPDPLPGPDPPRVAWIAGGLTAIGLLFTVALGLTVVATVLGVLVALGTAVMLGARRRDLRAARALKWERRRPSKGGRVVSVVAIAILLAAVLPAVEPSIAGWLQRHLVGRHDGRLWPFRGIALSLLAIAVSVHLSAMVDWALIRPRLLGALSLWNMPCQARRDEHSSNWALLTRAWLGHRFVVYVVVRVSLAVCIGFGAAAIIHPGALSEQPAAQSQASATQPASTAQPPATVTSPPGGRQATTLAPHADEGAAKKDWVQPVGTILGAIAAAILVFFINRMLPVWSLLANPRLDVGDHVVLAEEYGTGVDDRPEYYVVDIAIEGIKLLLLDRRGRPTGTVVHRRDRSGVMLVVRTRRSHDRSLDLADVPRLLRSRSRFTGCDVRCSGAYHDCPMQTGKPVEVDRPASRSESDGQSKWRRLLARQRSGKEAAGG